MSEIVYTVHDHPDEPVRIMRTNLQTHRMTCIAKIDDGDLTAIISQLAIAHARRLGLDPDSVDEDYYEALPPAHEALANVFMGTGDGHGFVAAVKEYDAYLRVRPSEDGKVVPLR